MIQEIPAPTVAWFDPVTCFWVVVAVLFALGLAWRWWRKFDRWWKDTMP